MDVENFDGSIDRLRQTPHGWSGEWCAETPALHSFHEASVLIGEQAPAGSAPQSRKCARSVTEPPAASAGGSALWSRDPVEQRTTEATDCIANPASGDTNAATAVLILLPAA